jgi:hypothetical protein
MLMRVPGNISVAAAIRRARRDNAMKDLRSLEEHMNDVTKKVAGVYPEVGKRLAAIHVGLQHVTATIADYAPTDQEDAQ